jgi:hypothetical protein
MNEIKFDGLYPLTSVAIKGTPEIGISREGSDIDTIFAFMLV